jgi:hypothetical protein
MQDVPKIVRTKLRRQKPATADPHPDADLLTAFAEHSLAARERDQVLDHLARCGDCREVVALTLPATEAFALASYDSTARVGWLSWPILRWRVVAAGILAVTSVGILQYRQRHQEKTLVATSLTSRSESPESGAQSSALTPHATPPQPVAPQPETGKQETAEKEPSRVRSALAVDRPATASNAFVAQPESTHRATSAGTIRGPVAGRGSGAGHGLNAAPRRELASAATAKQNPPPPTTAVEVSGAAPLAPTQTAQGRIQDQLIQNEPEAPSQDSAVRVGKAKSAAEQASPVMVPAPLLRTDPTLMGMAALRWTISASGALQRSLDGGKTWLDVNVVADSLTGSVLVPRSQTTTVEVQAEPATDKTLAKSNAKLAARPAASSVAPATAKPVEAQLASRTIFRAVAVSSNEAEVWAGGSGGALYHTVDAGNRWARVVPSDAGIVLTGDIIGIRFSDPRSGAVTTSNVEIWTTADAGQTWHKKP